VLRRQPNNLDAAINRGYILKKLGHYEEAERALRSALDLNP
jgi:Flp pilus assembly protein TadD